MKRTRHDQGSGLTQALDYTRVSSGEQEKEGYSLPAQLADIRRYVAAREWVIGGEFTDVMRGTRDDRPRYQALLTEARRLRAEGKPVVVVCKWLHRLGRKLSESLRCREEFKALGVAVHSVMEGGEVSDLVANIMGSVAEYEVDQLGERVREVNKHLRGNGWAKVGRCPWGYIWRDPTPDERAAGAPKRVLALDPHAAPAVVEMFGRVAAGESVRRVAEWAAGLSIEARGGRSLGYSVLQDALRAPVYLGQYEAEDGTLHQGRWPALVDQATWDAVQASVASHQHTPHQASGRYLLTGLLRCPQCGGRMVGRTRDAEGRARQYVCAARMAGANTAQPTCKYMVLAPAVEALVLAQAGALVDVQADPELLAEIRREWRLLQKPRYDDDVAAQLRRHEAQGAKARQRLKAAGLRLLDEVLSPEEYKALKGEVERDLAAAEAAIERLQAEAGQTPRPELPDLDVVLAAAGSWARMLREGDVPAQRSVLAELIETVKPVRVARGKYDVEIAWQPAYGALRALAEAV